MMKHSVDIEALKRLLPLPELMNRAGLEAFAKRSCRSPFREDKNSSWGIFEKAGRWFFKDLATGDTGDEITFLARHLKLNPRQDFKSILEEYARLAGLGRTGASPVAVGASPAASNAWEPHRSESSVPLLEASERPAR